MPRILLALTAVLVAMPAIAIEDVTARVTQNSGVATTPSRLCGSCHNQEFSLWLSHPHSRYLVNPAKDPRGVQGRWGKSVPGWKLYVKGRFEKGDVGLAFGVLETQVYFDRGKDGHRLLPAQWSLRQKRWEPLPEPLEKLRRERRTWEQECAGCHTTGFDGVGGYTEPNTGCSSCHGDGRAHAESGGRKPILQPATLASRQRSELCGRCHSRGRDRKTRRPYAVGYVAGTPLEDVFALEAPVLGQASPLFWPDGTERLPYTQHQGFRQSRHFQEGLACTTCHLAHGSDYPHNLRHKASDVCQGCHKGGPANCVAYGRHPRGAATCIDCHMARTGVEPGGATVHTHTFRFADPAQTRSAGMPNGCTSACHPGRPAVWAEDAVGRWKGR